MNNKRRFLTQPSSADLRRRHWAELPLRFDFLQNAFMQRWRKLSLRLQLPGGHLAQVDDRSANKQEALLVTFPSSLLGALGQKKRNITTSDAVISKSSTSASAGWNATRLKKNEQCDLSTAREEEQMNQWAFLTAL
ncbi:hypothetical protein EYF80_016850 [Liparis tanakae]|uniref:Uncharacterized protein n=1 Tax=Liparis tanakae TaxID=230148 RepID=A0A4Z2I573_9TELE|nr:hypothetical protein EYF80_016850 [Liparis tanakae]